MALSVHQDYGSKDASKLLCVTDISIQQCGSWLALTSSLLSCPHVRCIYNEVRVRLQGVRIDYALCTPGLLPKVVSCELDNLPPKWSDHAALMLGERAPALRTISCSHLPCLMGLRCKQLLLAVSQWQSQLPSCRRSASSVTGLPAMRAACFSRLIQDRSAKLLLRACLTSGQLLASSHVVLHTPHQHLPGFLMLDAF